MLHKIRFLGFFTILVLAVSLPSLANDITINNADFDAQTLSDGAFTSGNVQGWATISGSAGIYNPPASVLTSEGGDGIHNNTLYLNGNSVVSQTLNTNLTANTDYSVSFDVGDRMDTELPNYIVRIKVGGNTVFNAINPVLPQTDGSFETVNLSFNSGSSTFAGSLMTIELEATGSGQVNLDNFVITATHNISERNSQFGEWTHNNLGDTYNINTWYLAETDGFITYRNGGSCNGKAYNIVLGDEVGDLQIYTARIDDFGSMGSPVKKGQYWYIQRARNTSGTCTSYIGFLPLNH